MTADFEIGPAWWEEPWAAPQLLRGLRKRVYIRFLHLRKLLIKKTDSSPLSRFYT